MVGSYRWWLPVLAGTALCAAGRSGAEPGGYRKAQPPVVRKSAAATLVRLLDDPNPTVRTQAMIGLSRTHPPEAVPLLVPMLQSRDRTRVSLAIELLAGIKTRDALLPLIRLADGDKSDLRVEVAQRLCFEPSSLPEVHAFFERQSRSDDARLRTIAAAAMGNLLLPYGSRNPVTPLNPGIPSDPNALGGGTPPGVSVNREGAATSR